LKRDLKNMARKKLNNNNSKTTKEIPFLRMKKGDLKLFAGLCPVYLVDSNETVDFVYEKWNGFQKKFFEERTGFDLILKPRQCGATTFCLIQDLFFALTHPGTTTLICAQDHETAKGLLYKINLMIRHIRNNQEPKLGYRLIPDIEKDNEKEILFIDGTKIVAMHANDHEESADKHGRGTTFKRLHVSEISFYKHAENTMLAFFGAGRYAEEIVIESTPRGQNYFSKLYDEIKEDRFEDKKWKTHFYPWHCIEENRKSLSEQEKKQNTFSLSNARDLWEKKLIEEYKIDEEQLKWWRYQVSLYKIDNALQDYPIDDLSCFKLKGSSFLRPDEIDFLESTANNYEVQTQITTDSDPYNPIDIWIEPQERTEYIMGIDPSENMEDNKSLYVIEKYSGLICAAYTTKNINTIDFAFNVILPLAQKYNSALIICENQGGGTEILNHLERTGYENLYKQEGKDVYGFRTTGMNRPVLFSMLKTMIEQKEPIIYDPELVSEIKGLSMTKKRDGFDRIDHAKGSHDDRVMAYLFAQKARLDLLMNHAPLKVHHISVPSLSKFNQSSNNTFSVSRNDNNNTNGFANPTSFFKNGRFF
jgi:hypothetical protein